MLGLRSGAGEAPRCRGAEPGRVGVARLLAVPAAAAHATCAAAPPD